MHYIWVNASEWLLKFTDNASLIVGYSFGGHLTLTGENDVIFVAIEQAQLHIIRPVVCFHTLNNNQIDSFRLQ